MVAAQVPARVRTGRSAPPYLGAPVCPAASQGRGRGLQAGSALPFQPSVSLSIGKRGDGARWLRPGSTSALAPPTQAGAPDLHPAAERADLGRGRRRGLCSRSHVPTLRGVRVFTSLVGAGPHLKAAVCLPVPASSCSPSPSLCPLPSRPLLSPRNQALIRTWTPFSL